jgi:hypothetical protein
MASSIRFLFALCLTFLSGAAFAHHSTAGYDLDHLQSAEGTVKTVNWSNPHITYVVDIASANGAPVTSWAFEVSSPGVLTRSGWTKRSLQPGDHATFHYAPLRDGTQGGLLRSVTLPDGQVLSYSLTPADQ